MENPPNMSVPKEDFGGSCEANHCQFVLGFPNCFCGVTCAQFTGSQRQQSAHAYIGLMATLGSLLFCKSLGKPFVLKDFHELLFSSSAPF